LKNGDLVRGFTQLENGETMENNGLLPSGKHPKSDGKIHLF